MDILGKRKIWYLISLSIIVLGLIFLLTNGLNFGIDFLGGTLMEVQFDKQIDNEQVRDALARSGIKDIETASQIQQSATQGINGVIIRIRELNTEEVVKVENALTETFPSAEILKTNVVGPSIGEELRGAALLALLFASIAIVIYISIRFEFRFAIVAIIALLHDVLITIGLFAIMGKEINTPFVAALLTIVGYSINDTIVIFDRIRENMKLMHRESFIKLANHAVVDTLPRSINTSLTTLITILSIYFFGGASIKTFMLALFIGLFAGTYSSVFIASPLLVTWQNKFTAKAK